MFTVEVLQQVGKPPILIKDVSQVIVRLPDGSPVSVAAEYGLDNALLLSNVTDADFYANLQKLGVTGQRLIVEK